MHFDELIMNLMVFVHGYKKPTVSTCCKNQLFLMLFADSFMWIISVQHIDSNCFKLSRDKNHNSANTHSDTELLMSLHIKQTDKG